MFLLRFLAGNIVCMLIIGVIILIKLFCKKYLSAKYQYFIWFVLLASLIVAIMPVSFFKLLPQSDVAFIQNNTKTMTASTIHSTVNMDWMQDFSQTVYRQETELFLQLVTVVWIIGMVVGLILLIMGQYRLCLLRKYFKQPSENCQLLFKKCMAETTTKKVELFESDFVDSPMSIGGFRAKVILPSDIDFRFKHEELQYIMIHELIHVRHNDIFLNYILLFLQIIYWFNPLVWLAFRKIRLDREIYCDSSVIQICGSKNSIAYGYTLLRFANILSKSYYYTANCISGTKKQLKKRIINIATYKKDTEKKQYIATLIIIVVAACSFFQIPILSTFANENTKQDKTEVSFIEEDLSTFFNGKNGCFVLYDSKAKQYYIYNQKDVHTRVAPNSTYKIYSALNALEQKAISKEDNVLNWNGKEHSFAQWNQDQTLESAMQNSVNWYFQSLDEKLGTVEIQSFLNHIDYGNKKITDNISDYWLESSLLISPLEQVELLKNMYYNTFKFQNDTITAVQNSLFLEESSGKALYGKTGTGNLNGINKNGWFIGYVSDESDAYFFATYIDDDEASGKLSAETTLSILEDKQIYKKI